MPAPIRSAFATTSLEKLYRNTTLAPEPAWCHSSSTRPGTSGAAPSSAASSTSAGGSSRAAARDPATWAAIISRQKATVTRPAVRAPRSSPRASR